ncbi:MAG: NUDIX domain-containing protein [Alphaproteobacteria bacterium]
MNFQGAPLQVLTLVYLRVNGRVLMLKRAADKKILPNAVSAPGGKVEPGEDIYSAAVREYEEETGLTPLALNLRGSYTFTTSDPYNPAGVIYIFTAEAFRGTFNPVSPDGALNWLTPEEIMANPAVMADHKVFLEPILNGTSHVCCMGQWRKEDNGSFTLLQWADSAAYYAERTCQQEQAA